MLGSVVDIRPDATMSPTRNVMAEMGAIGLSMYDPPSRMQFLERLKPHHFSEPINAEIWELISDTAIDPVLIAQRLGEHPAFKDMGGIRYLADLVDKCPPRHAVDDTCEALLDAWSRREMVEIGKELQALSSGALGKSSDYLMGAERALAEIARASGSGAAAEAAGLSALDMVDAAYRGDFTGQPVGLPPLDHVTAGIRQDDVWVIGGRTSMGKSVMAVELARGLASQNLGVLFFSLEMPIREVQARWIAGAAFDREASYEQGGNLRYGDILKGRGDPHHQARAREAARAMASFPFVVNANGGLTIDQIKAATQRQFRAWEKAGVKPGGVIIDHIGLVKPERKTDNKAADTADTVNELKPLAKEVGAPVIALVQINRQTEGRVDKRPTLADLNWSGAIEQAADMICLIYREAYYLERSPSEEDKQTAFFKRHDMELIVAKNRQGAICSVKAYADVASNAIREAL